jgi:SNF2 family DNA or RNA helicase
VFKAHKYQDECIDFLFSNRCAGTFADPGLGKTAIVLHLLDDLFWQQKSLRVLLIAPLRVIYEVWPKEIEKWELGHLTYSILHGKNKKAAAKEPTNIHLINAENIFWHLDHLPAYDTLVIDESSKFKNPTSKRFKALKKRLSLFKRRIILTGTPNPNGLMDLWSQIYILDKGASLGRNITAYRNRFFYASNFRNFVEWQPKSRADESVQRLIAPLIDRIDADTHLDLPPLIEHTIEIELSADIADTYNSFEKKLFAKLPEGTLIHHDGSAIECDANVGLVLSSATAAYNVCRQIANGRLYKPPEPLSLALPAKDREILQLHSLKVEALKELLGELQGKPALVAYHYKHDLAQLLGAFGRKTPVIGGGTTAKETSHIIRAWNAGELPLLLGHPQSIGHGLNLQDGGRDVVWFSLTDNLESYLQFNRRIYRQGASGQTRVHHIVARGTVDVAIMDRLKTKNKNQRFLLDALARYREGKHGDY